MTSTQYGLGLFGAFLAVIGTLALVWLIERFRAVNSAWRSFRKCAADEYRERREPPSARVGSDQYLQNILRR